MGVAAVVVGMNPPPAASYLFLSEQDLRLLIFHDLA